MRSLAIKLKQKVFNNLPSSCFARFVNFCDLYVAEIVLKLYNEKFKLLLILMEKYKLIITYNILTFNIKLFLRQNSNRYLVVYIKVKFKKFLILIIYYDRNTDRMFKTI